MIVSDMAKNAGRGLEVELHERVSERSQVVKECASFLG